MIHKIKTYEIRSHGFVTKISLTGQLLSVPTLFDRNPNFSKAYVRRIVLHFQEVLKCMKQIAKGKEAKKPPHLTLPSAGPDDLFKNTPLDERANR